MVFVLRAGAHCRASRGPARRKRRGVEECKARIAAIARRHEVPFIDFNIRSEITANDANWWDRLHYRLPIADRVVTDIEQALATGKDDPHGEWRYLKSPAEEVQSTAGRARPNPAKRWTCQK